MCSSIGCAALTYNNRCLTTRNNNFVIRPAINNPNFGGFNGATCSAPSQLIEVGFYTSSKQPPKVEFELFGLSVDARQGDLVGRISAPDSTGLTLTRGNNVFRVRETDRRRNIDSYDLIVGPGVSGSFNDQQVFQIAGVVQSSRGPSSFSFLVPVTSQSTSRGVSKTLAIPLGAVGVVLIVLLLLFVVVLLVKQRRSR